MRLVYVNQDEKRVKIKEDLQGALNSMSKFEMIEIAPGTFPEDYMAKCEIMISHNTNILNLIRNPENYHAMNDWCVIISLSSIGVSDPPIKQDVYINNMSMKFYGFGIKFPAKQGFLNKEQWVSLLSWAAKITGKDIRKDKIINEMPSNLREMFCYKPMANLIALSILCYGYLMAHGGDGLRNREKWEQYYSESIASELKGDESKHHLKDRDYTETPAWWASIKDSEHILREMNDIQGGQALEEWKDRLGALVRYIKEKYKKDKYPENELTPLVKEAYKAYCAFEDSKARYL